jgi:hypothetical protein
VVEFTSVSREAPGERNLRTKDYNNNNSNNNNNNNTN